MSVEKCKKKKKKMIKSFHTLTLVKHIPRKEIRQLPQQIKEKKKEARGRRKRREKKLEGAIRKKSCKGHVERFVNRLAMYR